MSRKGIFNDPIAPTTKQRHDSPSAYGHEPSKEQATTGRYMAAGTYYGTGFRNPQGKMRASRDNSPIPQKAERHDPNTVA